MMRNKLIILLILFRIISSSAQVHKASCKIDYKLNTHTFGLLKNSSDAKKMQEKWNEIILKLQQELSSISTKNKKFEIKNDTLQVEDKISVKRIVQYNISNFHYKNSKR